MRVALRILAGIGLFVGIVYLLLYSNVPDLLEGTNLDGSTSVTWRSMVAMAVLLIACELFVFWVIRRRIALAVFGGFVGSVFVWMWLAQSRFLDAWEPYSTLALGGYVTITWRTDLILLGILCLMQGPAFAIRWLVLRGIASRRSLRG